MDHKQAEELLESYVVGALDEKELVSLEKHLSEGCDRCDRILSTLSDVPIKLARSAPERDPSPLIKKKILERISSSEYQYKRSGSFGRKYAGWLAAASLGVGLLVVLFRMGALENENQALRNDILEMEDVTSLLSSPGMEFIDLRGIGPNERAFGKVVYDKNKGNGVVHMYQLPQTPEGMQYQIWVMWEGVPTSAGVFSVDEDGIAVLKLTGLPDPTKIASFDVTIEPAGGLVSPTGMMYLTGPKPR